MINSEHINVKFDYFKKFTPMIKKKKFNSSSINSGFLTLNLIAFCFLIP